MQLCLCFICKFGFNFALDAKFKLISPCFKSVRTCKFYLADKTDSVEPDLASTRPLKGPLGGSVSLPHFLVIPVFHLFLSGGLSMSFSTDGAFHHPSVGLMSCLFAYTKHDKFFMVPHQPHWIFKMICSFLLLLLAYTVDLFMIEMRHFKDD